MQTDFISVKKILTWTKLSRFFEAWLAHLFGQSLLGCAPLTTNPAKIENSFFQLKEIQD